MKFRALCFAAPLLAAFVIGQAEARAPAEIEYASKPTTQMAALNQPGPVVFAKQQARGSLTSYGYGQAAAPASGPIIDLRGSFEDAPLAPAKRETYSQPPAPVEIQGPVDVRPPAGEETALLGAAADDSFAYAPPQAAGLYLVQVGAFAVRDNAERTRERASAAGAVLIDTVERDAGVLYRVRVGPWPSRDAAEKALLTVTDLGFADARVTTAD